MATTNKDKQRQQRTTTTHNDDEQGRQQTKNSNGDEQQRLQQNERGQESCGRIVTKVILIAIAFFFCSYKRFKLRTVRPYLDLALLT